MVVDGSGGSPLHIAVEAAVRGIEDLRGACVRLERGARLDSERRVAELNARLERDQAGSATKSANRASAIALRLRDISTGVARPTRTSQGKGRATGPLDVAEAVRVGDARPPSHSRGVPRNTSVPVLVPLLDHGNIALEGVWGDVAADLIQRLTLDTLLGTGAGQLVIHQIDPSLWTPLAALEPLRTVDESVLPPPATGPVQVGELLEQLRSQVRDTRAMIGGSAATLGQFRRSLGQPVGEYRLLVITDYPKGFREEDRAALEDLLRAGPTVGLSILLHSTGSHGLTAGHIATLSIGNGRVRDARLSGWSIDLGARDDSEIRDGIEAARSALARASAPVVDLAAVQPRSELMWDSSASGITACIGRSGTSVAEVTLGDERTQRHNVLVSGAVGQGKSNLLMALVHSLAQRYSPHELEMVLLDLKDGVTLFPLSGVKDPRTRLPHATVLGLNSDREFAASALTQLIGEFERRAAIIRAHGDNISRYRAAVPGASLPRILVVIDEFQVLFESDDVVADDALAALEQLARKGRAYGIHLVLASQTLSGISKLVAKQDGIFSQFPVRLALKNSASESQVVLGPQNLGAARLRLRGEVVINEEFGLESANRRAVVSFAEADQMAGLRSRLLASWPDAVEPLVFDGARPARLNDYLESLVELRRRAERSPAAPRLAALGSRLGVARRPAGFVVAGENARNLAVVGAASGGGFAFDMEEADLESSLAAGALQAAGISLAVQHPDADATFVLLDFLSGSQGAHARTLMTAIQGLGCVVDLFAGREATAWLSTGTELLKEPSGRTGPVYVIAFGMDRAPGLQVQGPDFTTPLDSLRRILNEGPVNGVHILGSWSTVRSLQDHLSMMADGSVQGVLALGMPASDVRDLFGPHEHRRPSANRGLLIDKATPSESGVIVPFAPVDSAGLAQFSELEWDG